MVEVKNLKYEIKKICHINCTDMVFHQYVFFDAVLDHFEQSFSHIDMVSHKCVFFGAVLDPVFRLKLLEQWFLSSVLSGALLENHFG